MKVHHAKKCVYVSLFVYILGQDNNDMAYWLSHACTLLFLTHKSLKVNVESSVQRRRGVSSSLFGRMTLGFRSSPTSETKAELIVQQFEGKYPALLFKQQLTAYAEKFYDTINHNLKLDLVSLLRLSIQAPRTSFIIKTNPGLLTSRHVFDKDSEQNQWQGIVDRLNTLLNTLKENCVPPVIVRTICAKIFSYINAQLFNSVLQRRECCTLYNGVYVKSGLAELQLWCCETKEEHAGSAWDELKHLRQAVGFLSIHDKHTISYDEITKDLCPILSIQQLYRICTFYYDDNSNNPSVSQDVITRMKIEMSEDSSDNASNAFLLDDTPRIPFPVDELFTSLQVEDFKEVKAVVDLAKYDAFNLKIGHKRITFGHGIA